MHTRASKSTSKLTLSNRCRVSIEGLATGTAEIDWRLTEGFRPLTDRELRVVELVALVETSAIYQAYTGLAGGGLADPEFAEFAARWIVEELRHGELLRIAAGGTTKMSRIDLREQAADARRLGTRLAPAVARIAHVLVGDAFLASYCIAGALVERSVIETYRLMEVKLAGTAVADLLPHIIRQEARHLAFYEAKANSLRRKRIARRISDAYARRLWQPLALNTLGKRHWMEIVGHLVQTPDDARRLRAVDRYGRERLGIVGFHGWDSALRANSLDFP